MRISNSAVWPRSWLNRHITTPGERRKGDSSGGNLPKIDAFVGDELRIERLPRLDQGNHAPQVQSAIHRDCRVNSTVVDVAGQEAVALRLAADDKLLPFRMESGVLKIPVVLIGPEPGYVVVDHRFSQHVARGGGALPHRVLPVLNPDVPVEDWMPVVGDVACRIDPLDVGSAVLVNDDAVLRVDPASIEEFHCRQDTDSRNHEVAFEAAVTFCDDRRDTVIYGAGRIRSTIPLAGQGRQVTVRR